VHIARSQESISKAHVPCEHYFDTYHIQPTTLLACSWFAYSTNY
jgi:hypothetical protein